MLFAIWVLLGVALWGGVHFGLAKPVSYPFPIADWGSRGDYATNAPQVQRLKDITSEFTTAFQTAFPTATDEPNPTTPPTTPVPTAS
ncbi:MAG: hypothetical protein ACRDJM_06195, partial [Actinomycetota bacterium]